MTHRSIPPRVLKAFEESVALGARSVTVAATGTPTLRIHLEPDREQVKDLRVFLTHATQDLAWADKVHDLLKDVGFQVVYLRPTIPFSGHVKTQEEISVILAEAIESADFLCMLFSNNSAAREWVRFEFAAAARLIGRVTMIKDHTVESIDDFEIPRFENRALLTVKYQVLDYGEDDPEFGTKLARMIINDPDEGVTDGRDRPFVIRERDLRREYLLRRFFRLQLDTIPEYTERHVVDILPFSWSEIGLPEGDIRGVFQWFVRKHGRLNMEVLAARRKIQCSLVFFPTNIFLSVRRLCDEPVVFALVIWKQTWNADEERRGNRGLI